MSYNNEPKQGATTWSLNKDVAAEDLCMKTNDLQGRNLESEEDGCHPVKELDMRYTSCLLPIVLILGYWHDASPCIST